MTITTLDNGLVIVPRPDWDSDADYPTRKMPRPVSIVRIHHTVTRATKNPCADARTVERVLDQRGLDGYNFLAHPSGVMLELAGDRVGEHTKGHNLDSYAYSLIGNYDRDQPTFIQLINIARCINLQRLDGQLVADLGAIDIVPHRATSATACPGANLVQPSLNGRNALQWIKWFAAIGA